MEKHGCVCALLHVCVRIYIYVCVYLCITLIYKAVLLIGLSFWLGFRLSSSKQHVMVLDMLWHVFFLWLHQGFRICHISLQFFVCLSWCWWLYNLAQHMQWHGPSASQCICCHFVSSQCGPHEHQVGRRPFYGDQWRPHTMQSKTCCAIRCNAHHLPHHLHGVGWGGVHGVGWGGALITFMWTWSRCCCCATH